jgi:hypothetical protein
MVITSKYYESSRLSSELSTTTGIRVVEYDSKDRNIRVSYDIRGRTGERNDVTHPSALLLLGHMDIWKIPVRLLVPFYFNNYIYI